MKRVAAILVAVVCTASGVAMPARAEGDDPLDRRICLKLTGVPLPQAVDALAAAGGVRVVWAWAEDAAEARDLAISLDARGLRLAAALRQVQRQAEGFDLGFEVASGDALRVAVGARGSPAGPLLTRRYRVAGLPRGDAELQETLADLIRNTVAGDHWDDHADSAAAPPRTIEFDGGDLVVRGAAVEHAEVEAVLDALAHPARPPAMPEHVRRKLEAPARLAALEALSRRPLFPGEGPRTLTWAELERSLADRGLAVCFDWRALEAAGIERTVDGQVPAGATALEAIAALSDFAGQPSPCAEVDGDGVVWVTTTERRENAPPIVCAYDLGPYADIEDPYGELAGRIIDRIAVESWVDNGGRHGRLALFGRSLVVVQTPDVQQAVADLLAERIEQFPWGRVIATRRYDVRDLTGGDEEAAGELCRAIVETVAVDSWVENGGDHGRLAILDDGGLEVTASVDEHAELAEFLDALRHAARPPAVPDAARAFLESPRRLAAEARLREPIVGPEPQRLTLHELAALMESCHFRVAVDEETLVNVGFDFSRAAEVPAGATVHDALEAIAPGDLAAVANADGSISLTGRWELGARTVLGVYDLAGIGGDGDDDVSELCTVVKETVDRDSWVDSGGLHAGMLLLGRRLIVRQTPENHVRIAKLIATWR